MAKVYRPRVPSELAHRIEAVKGDVPFEVWVRRALGAELDRLDRLGGRVPYGQGEMSPRASGASEVRGLAKLAEQAHQIETRPVKSFRGRPVGPIPKKSQKKPE
jgi:hypothetical protein